MKRNAFAATILIASLALPGLGIAGDRTQPWIHIEVLEDLGEGAKVKVNLPLSLARMALTMAAGVDNEYLRDGNLRIDNAEISVQDIRTLWRELKRAGDAEFVEVEDDGEVIRIYRRGPMVFVNVDDDGGEEKVRIEVPVTLVDALLSGEGETLDLAAALDELTDATTGDIVSIRDGRDRIRIWID